MAFESRQWTPGSYKNSVRDRARAAAKDTGAAAGELIDLHYHRRLLARVFHADPEGWVLKGGQALLVRWPSARYSIDIDLLSRQATTQDAVDALIAAAAIELDDPLRFEHYDTSEQTHIERPTRQVRFRVMLGNAQLNKMVSVDVVVSAHDPHGTVLSEPLEPPFTPDCEIWPAVRIFPIEDHLAEKICAMYERYRTGGMPSSRYKDLVDIVLIASKRSINGTQMHGVLQAEIQRRRGRGMVLSLPATFDVPGTTWIAGYSQSAQGVRELPRRLHTLDGARALADAFLTPLLGSQPPAGDWNPATQRWS